MNFDKQLIFFFSALGAFNGFILAFYFGFLTQKKKFSNQFLALLLLALSIRITKSVFFFFNPKLSGIFIQTGLSACILIGPFTYLYFKSVISNNIKKWFLHVFPFLIGIIILGSIYPYVEHRTIWSKWIVKGIYIQWFIYLIASYKYVHPIFKKIFNKKDKLSSIDFWLLSVFCGVTLVWLGYNIGSYTSYIVGSLSFSFVLYLMLLIFFYKNKKNSSFFEEKEKYKNKELDEVLIERITKGLQEVKEKELYLNSNITLTKVAKELHISSHILSQFINNNLGKSFSLYVNELRIEKAKELLVSNKEYSIESIGYESGFNSKSTFYTTFKKVTGQTPADFQKSMK